MKWRKHSSMERDELSSKIILRKFGPEGYGIYQILKEVIAENVLPNNYEDWGSVDALHDIESLSAECRTTPEKLREFLTFCNQKKVFEKKDGKLFCESMLQQLDDYAERIRNNRKLNEKKSEQGTKKVRQSKPKVVLEQEEEPEQEREENKKTVSNGFLQKLPDVKNFDDAEQRRMTIEDIESDILDYNSRPFIELVVDKVPGEIIWPIRKEAKQEGRDRKKLFTFKIMEWAKNRQAQLMKMS